MIEVRRSADRGLGEHGWLTTRHTFSFASYFDPAWMGFRSLRVLNEDIVAPGEGFGAHRHADMEILSMVMDGALAHRDSTGGEGTLRPGEVQRMSAGTGVVHAEFNASAEEPVHFFQIWIVPERSGIAPGYEQTLVPLAERRGRLALLAAPAGAGGAVTIRQDARVYTAILGEGDSVEHSLAEGRGAWLQVARGRVTVNGTRLAAGDGAAIEGERSLTVAAPEGDAEVLLFDLA